MSGSNPSEGLIIPACAFAALRIPTFVLYGSRFFRGLGRRGRACGRFRCRSK